MVQLTNLRAQVGSSRGGFVRGIEVRKLEAWWERKLPGASWKNTAHSDRKSWKSEE